MLLLLALGFGLVALYLHHVNRGLTEAPEEARRLSPHRWTEDEIKAAYQKNIENPINITKSLPPKQQRRYIVVGGTGLVGNWIVSHLLARGEDPSAIRILDLQSPRQQILDQGVAYLKTNIVDETSVSNAFSQPWPHLVAHFPLTVFHNAAVIRPAERHKDFLPLCAAVNVTGTENVLNTAKKSGTTCFISTSSGSIGLRAPSFWIAPWTKTPQYMVQVVGDSTDLPKEHDQFFGNYAVSKAEAEKIVREADDAQSNFRTGCIRPANGIYGIGGDASASIVRIYLKSGGNPTWTSKILQSFVNAENVSIAHLLYEQRLLDLTNPIAPSHPDIGGQSFTVTDPNPAPSFGDIYFLLKTLSKSPVHFPVVPAIAMYLFSYLVEWYALLQHWYFSALLPRVSGDLAQLQPGLFAISDVHVFADDSRARKGPELGGLGYNPPIGTLDGMCREVEMWNRELN
ncbi:hypothetical protein ASPWEDRAFT_170169 [Aspergillus wentii DTO 134E9]|uniref:3-beta hydroxysteroid dehydrogenase/isomerase domain-containing protein n=1 Tax=Aspergillus wentii DTO 134E9 TaxID=1073089 RepID=A0A1L9RNZ5_ASPWE|nr:uncharacterized protein ASPWEDRAFT_170169 [Aspergillus wentii DTO 134E9]KAI9934205.1 hypothetical protein MW887_005279 [Aspergillus wentii]OJJ36656.1 hypothetical protein ASPWEDRAFT_170169 [Aspergillus wentii DTO 134E9]